jgi:hypothetical protein
MRRLRTTLILSVILFPLMLNCAGKPKVPIYIDPDLESMGFETVTMLPVVDRRVDKSEEFDVQKDIGDRVVKRLEKKGYTVETAAAFSTQYNIPSEEVAEMEYHELAELGPADAHQLLVVYLDDASGKTGLGYTFKTETTAVLVDKSTGAMLWKDKGIGSMGQGGALGCMMAGATKGESMAQSVKNMMETLPKTPAKRK